MFVITAFPVGSVCAILKSGPAGQGLRLCDGLFVIDVLPAPDGKWRGLEKISILMGISGFGRRKSEQ